jgi:hypothetical protein
MLSVGQVYHISGLSVDAATEGEKNVVNNKLKLLFTSKTTLLSVIEECPDIPFQHLPPFLSFRDVPSRLRTRHNVIGTYNVHLPSCAFFLMHILPGVYKNFITVCRVDIIGMVVSISPLERTRNRGTARRELLLCDREYVFRELVFKTCFLMCVYLCNLNKYGICMCRMRTLRLTLWGDFAEVEGAYLQQHLFIENILLASRVHIRDYQGILLIEYIYLSFITFV